MTAGCAPGHAGGVPSPAAYAAESAAVVWLVLGVPLVGRLRYRALVARPVDRVAFYRRGIARQWLAALAVCAALLAGGLAPASIGLAWHLHEAVPLAPALAEVAAVGLAVVVVLRRQARRRPHRAWSERLLRPVAALLPRTAAERRWFAGVAVTAGATEELLYRGVVTLWFEQTWPALGPGGALVASSVAFGLAHAYQGPLGVALTGLAGYAFGVLYMATGSLLLPVVVHALLDLRVLLVLPVPGRPAPALTSAFVAATTPAEAPLPGARSM